MGRAFRAWGDKVIAEKLLQSLKSPSTCVRAELVLQAAGAGVKWNRTTGAHKAYSDWWKDNSQAFIDAGVKDGGE